MRRAGPAALLILGALSIAVSLVSDAVHLFRGTTGAHVSPAWLLVVVIPTFAISAWTYRRRPEHASARQLLAFGALIAVSELVGTIQTWVDPGTAAPGPVLALVHHVVVALTVVAVVRLIALYPDGTPERQWERRGLTALWAVVAVPPIAAISYPTVIVPSFASDPVGGSNPWFVESLAPIGDVAYPLVFATQGLVVVAIGAVVARYRRGDERRRRRIRWLLVPAIAVGLIVLVDLLLLLLPATEARSVTSALWLPVMPLWTAAIAAGLSSQQRLRVDLVLRRSLVYGTLWTLIAVAYVALAAAFGLAAADRLPVEVAIVTTILATMAFQPLRRWLEGLADRWVFGERLGRYESLRRLGHSLEQAQDLQDLLPHLASTIRQGLGLASVRVVVATGQGSRQGRELEGRAGAETEHATPDVVVPIVQAGEDLGRIECVTVGDHDLDRDDLELLRELARQSGLAIRNVRLTRDLEDTIASLRRRTDELQRSRARLIRVQDEERRRLERDLHDGVQQHIVATIAQVGLARRHAERNPGIVTGTLAELQRELGSILDELRELARGVHPSLLSAGGLVAAVEAQTSRSPVPVTVRADADVREQRYAPEVEGAAYFTVTESLANVLKHAHASAAEVSLSRRNGTLLIVIRDDGRGFDPDAVRGVGLQNLAGRVEALGGHLSIDSCPGAGTTVTAELALDTAGADRG